MTMTPMSHVSSGELIPAPNKPTTDKVTETPKASPATATASTSTAVTVTPTSSLPRNPLAIQLVSFFFDNIQRIFKVPTSVDLTHRGYEVTFSTESIAWPNDPVPDKPDPNANEEDRRVFEIMAAPANAALHRYIKDLEHVRTELAALKTDEEDEVVKKLKTRVMDQQVMVTCWTIRVCKAAGELGIADPAFSLRK